MLFRSGSIPYRCDLADEAAVEALIERFPVADLLINAAGFARAGVFAECSWPEIQCQVEVNLLALTRLCHHFMKAMRVQGHGVILNIGSSAVLSASPDLAVYAAAKSFVHSLSRSLAIEGEGRVRVKCLFPCPTESAFAQRAGLPRRSRMNQPAEIAAAALRLIDNDSRIEMLAGRLARIKALTKFVLPVSFTTILRNRLKRNRAEHKNGDSSGGQSRVPR